VTSVCDHRVPLTIASELGYTVAALPEVQHGPADIPCRS
jgi:hypothetical protein